MVKKALNCALCDRIIKESDAYIYKDNSIRGMIFGSERIICKKCLEKQT